MKFTILVDPFLVIITKDLVCLIHAPVQTRRGEEILHFHYTANAQAQESLPIYNFGRLSLHHHNYILNVSGLCLGVEKKNFKEIMHFH